MAMPTPAAFQGDDHLPQKTEILVIGGGIIGATAALELAERGIDVTLCEKGIIAGEQSGRNWGWVRKMGRDPAEIELIIKAHEIWDGLDKRIGGDTGFTRCGITYLFQTDREIATHEKWLNDHALPAGIDSRMIGRDEIKKLFPDTSSNWKAALYTPDDGRAEPQLAAPAIATAARKAGAKVLINCAVRGFEKKAGKIAGVVTEKGAIACQAVILAGGAWSRHLMKREGLDLPQLTTISSVLRTTAIDGPETTAGGDRFAFRKRADGGYTVAPDFLTYSDITPAHFKYLFKFLPTVRANRKNVRLGFGQRFFDEWNRNRKWQLDEESPFEKTRTLDPAPIEPILNDAWENLKQHFPMFANAAIAQSWAGCIDVMPDEVPVIDEVSALPGLFIATGFSGHGFGLGPGAGRLISDLATNSKPFADPKPFRLNRF